MGASAVRDRIRESLLEMPAQMRTAARFIVDHPSEVALLSMREQARMAGVPPATMTRLAQRLGFSGFNELKDLYAETVREGVPWFSGRAVDLLEKQNRSGPAKVAAEIAQTIAAAIGALAHPDRVQDLQRAARILAGCRRTFAIGARAMFPVAFTYAYTQSYFWSRARLLDGPGATGIDQLGESEPGDAMLAASLRHYAASTLRAVEAAHRRGLRIVAITDSDYAPIARLAECTICVSPHSNSFFDTVAPAVAAVEIIVALIASHAGKGVPDKIRAREEELLKAGVFTEQD
jgi:DNA-binding MurR/RpiR family transcriptional regulator